ncbi:SNAP receptor [Hanseniaspora osmophila]|uniref:Protein transport protein SEC22 n=1 Tax=Hanseniaspora osmophila TaxID=56408 RepID=A0A1E5REY9_9ASCO|nr:Protein transport protein SEC22 [Hanseniaspora osmophila]
MIKSTLIYREDGLPLCTSVDDDNTDVNLNELKKNIKKLLSKFTPQTENEATMEFKGELEAHYIRKNSIIYFVIVERNSPTPQISFSYLKDISVEFEHNYSNEYWKPTTRPYQFVSFDTFLQKTIKLYNDKRVFSNLDQLNNDLKDVKQIMTKNIEDILYRGDSLDKMSDMSYNLKNDARKYKKSAQKINLQLLISQYAPIAGVAFLVVLLIWWKFIK